MSAFTPNELDQLDRFEERRQRAADFKRHHPEYQHVHANPAENDQRRECGVSRRDVRVGARAAGADAAR